MEEAWLSGAIEGMPRELMPAAHALVQAKRDIENAVRDLSVEQVWCEPPTLPSVGFHLRHVAGSLDRLLTYARNESLTGAQHEFLKHESEPGTPPESTTSLVTQTLARIDEAVEVLRRTSIEILYDARFVGRRRLETNVFGLLFHLAEHTQRHAGQIITTAKIVKARLR